MSERYPKFINTPDRGLVRESVLKEEAQAALAAAELDVNAANESTEREEVINNGRRRFLKGAAVVAGTLAVPELLNTDEEAVLTEERERHEAAAAELVEKGYVRDSVEYQLALFGEVKDMERAVESKRRSHYEHLVGTEKGVADMQIASKNIQKLDVLKFVQPFIEEGFSPNLAYMLAIQETRGRVIESWAGAKGVTGIMPDTAKAYGFEPKDVDDPYIASKVSAKYFTDEKSRFGDNLDMLCHAYNGGGSLFGFTKAFPKNRRTPENFYEYMSKYINIRYAGIKSRGCYEHTVDNQDESLTSMSKRFQVSVQEIVDQNGMKNDIIRKGQILKIPYEDPRDAIKIIFRKPLEVLNYTPEIEAKYDALKELGEIARIEKDLEIQTTALV